MGMNKHITRHSTIKKRGTQKFTPRPLSAQTSQQRQRQHVLHNEYNLVGSTLLKRPEMQTVLDPIHRFRHLASIGTGASTACNSHSPALESALWCPRGGTLAWQGENVPRLRRPGACPKETKVVYSFLKGAAFSPREATRNLSILKMGRSAFDKVTGQASAIPVCRSQILSGC